MNRSAAQDPATRLVADALLDPRSACGLGVAEWGRLMQGLRHTRLLATFAERLVAAGAFEQAPAKARMQMTYARIAAGSTATAVRFEAERMLRALRGYDGPLVLLKGAAYELAALAPAQGRVTGDLDVMVPRSRLEDVERMLVEHGWEPTTLDPYDQRYYREWTHEVPALRHPRRETPLDLHHSIAPPLGRSHPVPDALFASARPSRTPGLSVLGPCDAVVHAALHLFNDEVAIPLRDLFDIHLLLDQHSPVAGFWGDLVPRAALHGASRPLHYALRMCREIFASAIPDAVVDATSPRAASATSAAFMSMLFRVRFSAGFAVAPGASHRAVDVALRGRAHWLRMPPLLLARHLGIKASRRLTAAWERRGPAR